jgi:hypothetical protein
MADRLEVTTSRDGEAQAPASNEKLLNAALLVLGVALAGAGTVAVFTTDSDAGAAALIAVGMFLVLIVGLGDRLESLRYGNLEVVLRRKAEEAASRGDIAAARTLARAADTVGQRAARVGRSYTSLRGATPAGPARTAMMDNIIIEAGKEAHAADIDQDEVLNLLWTGSEGSRVWALAILEARPELATTRAVLEAVQRPDQMFDQFHALLLAERVVSLPETGFWPRKRIGEAVESRLRSGALGDDEPALEAARRVIDVVSRRSEA